MRKIFALIIFVFLTTAAFGQEEIFKHIDYFIENFPKNNQEAEDKLASWGYIKDGYGVHITSHNTYLIMVWPLIGDIITFRFEFQTPQSHDFYQVYRNAITYFTEKYNNYSININNNDYNFRGGHIDFSISYFLFSSSILISIANRSHRR